MCEGASNDSPVYQEPSWLGRLGLLPLNFPFNPSKQGIAVPVSPKKVLRPGTVMMPVGDPTAIRVEPSVAADLPRLLMSEHFCTPAKGSGAAPQARPAPASAPWVWGGAPKRVRERL